MGGQLFSLARNALRQKRHRLERLVVAFAALHEEALDQYIALFDHKVATGYDFIKVYNQLQVALYDAIIDLGERRVGR